MKIVIFDILTGGHHSEYIDNLVEWIGSHSSEDEFYFVIHEQIAELKNTLISKFRFENIFYVPVSHGEAVHARSGNIIQRSTRSFYLMDKYSQKIGADHVYLMSINSFQFSLIFFRPEYKISGILFMPFSRLSKTGINNKLNYYRKLILTWLLCKNTRLSTIHLLNDHSSCESLNQTFRTNIFSLLPDPIPSHKKYSSSNQITEKYQLPKNHKLLLHFGTLGDRKGTLEVIQSMSHLTETSTFLFIAGKAESTKVHQEILQSIKLQQNKGAIIYYINGFIEDTLMFGLCHMASIVIIPYKKAEGSSGLLGHAAASNTPVLATNKGLIGYLVKKYKLGNTINTVTPKAIADEIKTLLSQNKNAGENELFIAERTPALFAEKIVSSLQS
jgi:glycosyltransferase involved in cell wall biosynthesis